MRRNGRCGVVLLSVSIVLLVAACSSAGDGGSDDPFDQSWYLGSMSNQAGEVAFDSPAPPSVDFRPAVRAFDGCRSYEIDAYRWDDPTLTFDGISVVVPDNGDQHPCPDLVDPATEAMQQALTQGVEMVTLTADEMVWEIDDATLVFYAGVEG